MTRTSRPRARRSSQPAPGVLANDSDSGGGTLVVDTTPVVAPGQRRAEPGRRRLLHLHADARLHGRRLVHLPRHERRERALRDRRRHDHRSPPRSAAPCSTSTPNGPTSDLWDISDHRRPSALRCFVPDYDGDLAAGPDDQVRGRQEHDHRPAQIADVALAARERARARWPGHAPSLEQPDRQTARPSSTSTTARRGGGSCTQISSGTLSDNTWNGLLLLGSARHLGRHRQPHPARRTRACASACSSVTATSGSR